MLGAGVVLAGVSAGSLWWHRGGPTDSFGDQLAPFTDGLGLVSFSNGVHDDFADQPRRCIYRDLIASSALTGGCATEDGRRLALCGHRAARSRQRGGWQAGLAGRAGRGRRLKRGASAGAADLARSARPGRRGCGGTMGWLLAGLWLKGA